MHRCLGRLFNHASHYSKATWQKTDAMCCVVVHIAYSRWPINLHPELELQVSVQISPINLPLQDQSSRTLTFIRAHQSQVSRPDLILQDLLHAACWPPLFPMAPYRFLYNLWSSPNVWLPGGSVFLKINERERVRMQKVLDWMWMLLTVAHRCSWDTWLILQLLHHRIAGESHGKMK